LSVFKLILKSPKKYHQISKKYRYFICHWYDIDISKNGYRYPKSRYDSNIWISAIYRRYFQYRYINPPLL